MIMSTLLVDSPIQRLDFDLLWCIIKVNADDMFNDKGALDTTLATSRVCRDWRYFMLSATSIWAHLIDLDHRLWRTIEGRRELFRRSGNALLWIKAHTYVGRRLRGLSIIVQNWGRVQKLEITIAVTNADQWKPLYLPAPHLELFVVSYKQKHHVENLVLSPFCGSAPMLRAFRFNSSSRMFNLTTPWLGQLRSMELNVNLTVSETLGLLLLTENLINLRLDRTAADHTTMTQPSVVLPNLTRFILNSLNKLSPGAVLLDHIFIPPACSLMVSGYLIQHEDMACKATLGPIIETISTCAQRRFTYYVPQTLVLIFTASHLMLLATTHTSKKRPAPGQFSFNVALSSAQVFPARTLPILLSNFALPGLSNVTKFAFVIYGINHPVPELAEFIACLPAVNIINTDKWSLRHLIRAQAALKRAHAGPRVAFPALEILQVVPSPVEPSSTPFDSAPDPVSKFIMARIAHGHAVGTIDLTTTTLDVLPDMEFLRKAHGLKVLWRQSGVVEIREYICGTGAPHNSAPNQ